MVAVAGRARWLPGATVPAVDSSVSTVPSARTTVLFTVTGGAAALPLRTRTRTRRDAEAAVTFVVSR